VLNKANYPPEKIYLCLFNEDPDWHLHFHIIPRAKQEVIVGPRLLLTNHRRKITKEEIENAVNWLRGKLKHKLNRLTV
jgi:diadenosine tetraphosphate (Ap4A) HIT family hydrolase